MSAGGALEIPSFLAGLSGFIAVFDKACVVWRTLSSAKDFGRDVVFKMTVLEMEYFRFQVWWTALESIAADLQRKSDHSKQSYSPGTLQHRLQEQMASPILNAASTILEMLEEMETILRGQGCLSFDGLLTLLHVEPGKSGSVGVEAVNAVASGRSIRARALLRSTPFYKRVVHNSKPWGEPDKARMDDILSHLKYCNDYLYGILPQRIRDSVLEQGIAGYIMDDHNVLRNVLNISKEATCEPSLSQTIDLFLFRHSTKRSVISSALLEELRSTKCTNKDFETVPDVVNNRWSITEYIGESKF
jgi:hypothetical protein